MQKDSQKVCQANMLYSFLKKSRVVLVYNSHCIINL